jgi:hypothetical protein
LKNRVELKSYIRYQLTQLSARNGEHEFELLAFELARLRHVSNLQPATGPVKAGGDQGRDFESYKTYLTGTSLARSSFVTLAADHLVVGACTLNKKTPTKIRSDLKIIFASGNRPKHVLYFCEPDVPVAKRHELQSECRKNHQANLDIFDGQAIADQLSDPDTFWIAEQYLAVPAEFYPKTEIDQAYENRRDRWIGRNTPAINHGDFIDIKIGLRTASREEEAKPDLVAWIARMRSFADEGGISRQRQKARYEIAVAELRGRGNLDPALPYVESFFKELEDGELHPADLLDAAVLAIYCWGAFGHLHSNISLDAVKGYIEKVQRLIELSMAETTRRGDRCQLLEARAMLAVFPPDGLPKNADLQRAVDAWRAVVGAIEEVPFYPISHIADLVEMIAPVMGKSEEFRNLRDEIDSLSKDRAGGHEVAERSRRRAQAHLDAGNRLAAIDELQRAKVGAFTGDEMTNSVLAMLVLSKCYSDLGLHMAARYYAAGASYIALHSDDDDVRRWLPRAAFALVQTFYDAGECTTFLLALKQGLATHLIFEQDPANLEKHPDLQRAFAHAAIFKAVARRLAPELDKTIDDAVSTWPFKKNDIDRLMKLGESPQSSWTKMSIQDIEDTIERDLGRSPFCDIGDPREISWSALGVTWTIRHAADQTSTLAALELAATLQIAQVEFAEVELLIIPSDVLIMVETGNLDRPDLEILPDNRCLTYRVILPAERAATEDFNVAITETMAVVATVIGQATALDQKTFKVAIERCFERGLPLRIFSVRPAREMMEFALAQANGIETLNTLKPIVLSRPIKTQDSPELGWRSGPGPGYSLKKAHEFLTNRYRRTSEIIKLSLPKLLANERIRLLLLNLKAKGFLDWQILSVLASIVGQYQVEASAGHSLTPELAKNFRDRMSRAESTQDAVFDLSIIDEATLLGHANTSIAATFHTWGLGLNRQTPDLVGMKRLLDERYGHSTDDIPHPDFFSWSTAAEHPPVL